MSLEVRKLVLEGWTYGVGYSGGDLYTWELRSPEGEKRTGLSELYPDEDYFYHMIKSWKREMILEKLLSKKTYKLCFVFFI